MYIYYSFSQADIAESLATLTLQQPESDYTRAVGEGCRNMLRALGEQRDYMASEHAPQPQSLPRPIIPAGRPGKRAHGFMTERDPFVNDQDDNNDVEPDPPAGPFNLHMPPQRFDDSGAGPSHQPNVESLTPVSIFFTPGPSQPSHRSGYFSSMLYDPNFEYGTQFFPRQQMMQDLNQGFAIPNQFIPAYQSPAVDLIHSQELEPTVPTNNIAEEDDDE